MTQPKIMELYEKLGTQEKRAVNRLIRALASGQTTDVELRAICRAVSRNTTNTSTSRPSKSAYILYYKQRYPALRMDLGPQATLGQIAKAAAKEWRELGQKGQAEYYARAWS